MIQALGVAFAVLVGAAAGWLLRRVPVRPIAQDLGAAVLGWVIGVIVTTLVMLMAALWGYGTRDELLAAGPEYFAPTVADVLAWVQSANRQAAEPSSA